MHSLRTYIVEDSPVIRESLIAALEELAPIHVVGTADNESSAVSWLSEIKNHYDLLIVDIFLKSGSGLGVLKSVGELPGLRNVVVLSNYATQDIREKCMDLGADKVFDKSNDIDALINYCNRLSAGDTGHGPLDYLT